MTAEITTRDALIAEMLGDIGRLHDSVESLRNVLPNQIEEVETKITTLIGLLMKAGDAYKAQLENYTNVQDEKIRHQLEKEAIATKTQFELDSKAAIQEALAEVGRIVKSTINTEISEPVQHVLISQKQNLWKTLALCLACGIIGGGIVLSANQLAYDREEAEFANLGKVVAASWDKLDKKAKATIIAETKK